MPPPNSMTTSLTSKQRAHLRKLAHHLKAVVHVGNEGVTPALLGSVSDALNTRELIKIKLQESAPVDVREAARQITEGLRGTHVAQTIGRTMVLYREHPDTPEIKLP